MTTSPRSRRPSRKELEAVYRLGGEEALWELARALGWKTLTCPLCGPPTPDSRAHRRARSRHNQGLSMTEWEKDLALGSALDRFACDLCDAYRRLEVPPPGIYKLQDLVVNEVSLTPDPNQPADRFTLVADFRWLL